MDHVYRAALALLATVLLLPGPANALTLFDQQENGSFEDWNATCTMPDAWTVEIGDVVCSAFATEGASAAQLRAKPNLVGSHLSVLAQTIPQGNDATDLPIVPGIFYELRFDAAGIYNGKGNGNATLTWVGFLGNTLRVDTVVVPESTGYAHFEQQFQAPIDPLIPDAATSVLLRFLVDGQSSDDKVNLWVDDVHFGPSGPVGIPALPA